ncbi:MAG: L-lactate dehydrogenase [Clostridiaceae bacterium]|nr:L-lactate dehydrogenase [Clostridiaceae bacterium]
MGKKGTKVCIIGAGNVGANLAYVMSIQNTCKELVLIDVAKNKAEGEVMDIIHGLPFLNHMEIRAGSYQDVKGADVIVVTAGAGRKPGETRLDLASKNVGIAKAISDELMKYYDGGIILVVSNPVDVITYHFSQWTGLPNGRVVGSGTVLDGIRFRTLLGRKFDIDFKNVHAYILGEHGETQFPSWSYSRISGLTVDEYCKVTGVELSDEEKAEIAYKTRTAGAEVIKNKGATFYGIGIATNALCESILHDENTIRTVGSVLNGEYGLNDVVVNVPSILGRDGVEKILEIDLPENEMALLHKSAESIKAVIDATKHI